LDYVWVLSHIALSILGLMLRKGMGRGLFTTPCNGGLYMAKEFLAVSKNTRLKECDDGRLVIEGLGIQEWYPMRFLVPLGKVLHAAVSNNGQYVAYVLDCMFADIYVFRCDDTERWERLCHFRIHYDPRSVALLWTETDGRFPPEDLQVRYNQTRRVIFPTQAGWEMGK
jgi:hypothetical protein